MNTVIFFVRILRTDVLFASIFFALVSMPPAVTVAWLWSVKMDPQARDPWRSEGNCLCCADKFTLDVRNRGRQKYCAKQSCRAAGEAARQRR